MSLNLINGFTGQFSIGHAGFMAVGAYTSAMFTLRVGAPWPPRSPPAGVPAAGRAGRRAADGAAARRRCWPRSRAAWSACRRLRLRGDYLAIVTLGFGEIIRVLILNIDAVGGARGLPGIPR